MTSAKTLSCRRLVLLACFLAFYAATTGANEPSQQQQLERIKSAISQTQQQLSITHNTKDDLNKQLKNTEKKVAQSSRTIRELKQKITLIKRKLKKLAAKNTQQQQQIAQQRKQLGAQLRAQLMLGQQSQLKLLLNEEDPAKLSRQLTRFNYLNQARTQNIKQLQNLLAENRKTKTTITQQGKDLQSSVQQQHDARAVLHHNLQRQKILVTHINQQLATQEQRLQELLNNKKALTQLITRLGEESRVTRLDAPAIQNFPRLKGKLPWPVSGSLTTKFNRHKQDTTLHQHGVLISAALGKDINAIAHGRIAFADWIRGYGLLIIIDHGDGYMSLYGHVQSFLRDIGDWVSAGETIATLGKSGGQKQARLYFEIRQQGQPVDPQLWCKRQSQA